jgi:DNA repair protein RadC
VRSPIEKPERMKTPYEFKIMRVRECLAPDLTVETPAQAAEYWKQNIPPSAWFDPNKEALVALVLNTKRRIIGHNLVTLGLLDTCMAHPRESSDR